MKYILFISFVAILFSCNGNEAKQSAETKKDRYITWEDSTLLWTDYRIGELPPDGYYDAFDSIVRKWNIRYIRKEGGCEATEVEKQRHEAGNEKYFRQLEKKYGKNWRQRFDDEVQQLDALLEKQKRGKKLSGVKPTPITIPPISVPSTVINCAFTGSWQNSKVFLNISESTLVFLYHGQCAYFYPIKKISDTEFEMIWTRDMDCKFDNGTAKTFGLKNVPAIGKPFAKFTLKNKVLHAQFYYKEWVKRYTEQVQENVFTNEYTRRNEND